MGSRQIVRGGHSNKVRNLGGDENRDLISDLPGCIISHILSCLPARDAVRTSVLSKTWEYNWTSIYNIRVDVGRNFARFMDGILFNVQNIQSFDLQINETYDANCMNSWISTIFRRNAKSVKIVDQCRSDRPPDSIILSRSFLNCTSLRILELSIRCMLKVSVKTCFLNLTSLKLNCVQVSSGDSNADTLTFEFPVLETLVLYHCKWLNVMFVEFCSPALSSVAFCDDCTEGNNFTIKILGAKLAEFKTFGLDLRNFLLVGSTVDCAVLDIQSSSESWIDVFENDGLKIRRLLNGFSNLEKLVLQTYVVQAISVPDSYPPSPKLPKYPSLREHDKLRWLAISGESGYSLTCDMVTSLFELLHAAPCLKRLDIDMYNFYEVASDFDYKAMVHVPSCIVSHLEEVKLESFSGEAPELHLAEFIIMKGVKLKKLTVSVFESPGTWNCEEVAKELSRFPQASASLIIDVTVETF